MAISYKCKSEKLSQVVEDITRDATYVIPDLQRPYVWAPRQVILLMDSLIRGWPFGSLLLWEVDTRSFPRNEGIPHRPFWKVVDRTMDDAGSRTSTAGSPAKYCMVLDGQQRIQSLVLALGGDQWGFKLNDSDWASDIQDRRVKPSNHWSKGILCVNLDKFKELFDNCGSVRKMEVSRFLEWVVLDGEAGRSSTQRPHNYVFPIEDAQIPPQRFIRLSRLWKAATAGCTEGENKGVLTKMLQEHGIAIPEERHIEALAQFLGILANIKENGAVHVLEIAAFQESSTWTKDDYSDAIVNIFTRLNTAGRVLTREEITLAWLKVGWVISDETYNKSASVCLRDLTGALEERGFVWETDEIVRLISFVWAVEAKNGILLDAKDFLNGDAIRPLAVYTANRWKQLKEKLELGADLIKSRGLPINSVNAAIVFLAWYKMVSESFNGLEKLQCVPRDEISKTLNTKVNSFIDRWFLGSDWAGVWGDSAVSSFQGFAKDLAGCYESFQCCSETDFIEKVDASIARMIERIESKALQYIDSKVAGSRQRVRDYFNMLWVWHRLDSARWGYSSVPLRTDTKKASKIEVDHMISDAWWQELVDQEMKKITEMPEGAPSRTCPVGFESLEDARAFVNRIGNCSLLEKSFNISKGKRTMWAFLGEVSEFKTNKYNRNDWQTAFLLCNELTDPTGSTLNSLKTVIEYRDTAIRNELKEFIRGQKFRFDVQ